jgi:DNA-binding XRE family transcriptional regulator
MDITQFENEKQLTDFLCAWRKRLSISQKRVADAAHVNRTTITLIEQGKFSPQVKTLLNIVHVLRSIEAEKQPIAS